MQIRRMLLIAAAALSLGAAAASAAPVCGAWGPPTSEGKKEKTIDGKKHICDASTKSRSCCTYGKETSCYTQKETTYENCTPASASRPPQLRPPGLGPLDIDPGPSSNGPSRPGTVRPTTPPTVKIY